MCRGRYKTINPEMPHFLTLTVLHWIPVFFRSTSPEVECLSGVTATGCLSFIPFQKRCNQEILGRHAGLPLQIMGGNYLVPTLLRGNAYGANKLVEVVIKSSIQKCHTLSRSHAPAWER